ncbi:MAG: envelope stress response membrane protein PspB [Pseudomonadota bacterium]
MFSEYAGIMGIIFISVILPILIVFHYITKWKQTKSLSTEDERMLEDLWENAQKMESRINTLETILDKTTADWRKHT